MKPNCRLCGTKMYQTHSRNDFSCITCGQSVWFNVAYPTGKWSDPSPAWARDLKIRAEKAQRGLEVLAAEPGVTSTRLCEYKARIVVCSDAEAARQLKAIYPNGFAGIIPLVFETA